MYVYVLYIIIKPTHGCKAKLFLHMRHIHMFRVMTQPSEKEKPENNVDNLLHPRQIYFLSQFPQANSFHHNPPGHDLCML